MDEYSRTSKPDHLAPEYGAQFADPSVADHYHLRPQYPDETFDILDRLIVDRSRVVLDVGAGTGAIARGLVARVDRVDAVDPSLPMIERGRRLPGGDAPNLRWIHAPAENAPLDPPYALITAGASLHWMEWSVVLPRFRDALAPSGMLAIVSDITDAVPWREPLQALIDRYSTNRKFRPYNVIDEVERRGLFRPLGHHRTAAIPFTQTIEDYVGSFHARNGFSRDRMAPADAAAFGRDAAALVREYAPDGTVTLRVTGEIVWGLPSAP
ncbi:MAG TPA: class I SAM-dependent methyltransferase [Thermomicrobiales bacterium]|nr:class I SAM-dependent methyltransferase [Thermomicrobiales bacterium]